MIQIEPAPSIMEPCVQKIALVNPRERAVTSSLPALSLAALGVVFGDIGTSPLYTLKTVLGPPAPIPIRSPRSERYRW